MGTEYWRGRADPDYLLRAPELRLDLVAALQAVVPKSAFWATADQ
jgi:hypothetical protein